MDKKIIRARLTEKSSLTLVKLEAEPEPLEIVLEMTGLIIVDMQNGFVKKGGFFDLHGVKTSPIQKIIGTIKKATDIARANRCKIIYIVVTYTPDFRETGGPDLSSWYKLKVREDYNEHPEWRDKLLIRGTWGAEIIEELKPEDGDIVVQKPKYSAFFGTNLDMVLKTFGIKYLMFTGIAANTCVESSIRDAYYLGYFPILVSDGTAANGPKYVQNATIFNIKLNFGWVTNIDCIEKAIGKK